MDQAIVEAIAEREGNAVVVTVIEVTGSAPRHPGSAMLVRADGAGLAVTGSVGGGAGEAGALEAARAALADGHSRVVEFEMRGADPEGDDVICGGTSRMLVEYIEDFSTYRKARDELRAGRRVVLDKRIVDAACGGTEGARSVAATIRVADAASSPALERAIRSGAPSYDGETGSFLDPVLPAEKLLVVGGGSVALAVVAAAKPLGFDVTVIDDRPAFASPERFGPGVRAIHGSYKELIDAFPFDEATYAVVLTRGHLFDLEACRAVLSRPRRYIGLIASRRKGALLRERLASDGFANADIASIHSPIGLEIGAETPEEIAVSIVAELVSVRRLART